MSAAQVWSLRGSIRLYTRIGRLDVSLATPIHLKSTGVFDLPSVICLPLDRSSVASEDKVRIRDPLFPVREKKKKENGQEKVNKMLHEKITDKDRESILQRMYSSQNPSCLGLEPRTIRSSLCYERALGSFNGS